jgi:uncharacterized protein
MRMDLSAIPAIDTHCHPFPPAQSIVSPELLRNAIGVSLAADASPLNDTALLNRMVVRGLAALLGCDQSWDAVVAARNAAAASDVRDYHRRLFADANVAMVLIDPGFPDTPTILAEDFEETVPCPVLEGYRIERFTGEGALHVTGHATFVEFIDAFQVRLDDEAARPRTRFFKTVIAYLTGLAIRKVSESEARAAWDQRGDDPGAEKTLRDYLFWLTALKSREHNLPFQIHTGHTSQFNPWPNVNPILLTPLLNDPELRETPFVLVHGGYPYCTEAGYMTSIYPNVALDLSLMIPWSGHGIARRLEETLEAAPTAKIMYGSDAIYVPELYWISAKNARRALGRVLDRLIDDEVLDADEAKEVAGDILHRNAERIYGVSLDAPPTDAHGRGALVAAAGRD